MTRGQPPAGTRYAAFFRLISRSGALVFDAIVLPPTSEHPNGMVFYREREGYEDRRRWSTISHPGAYTSLQAKIHPRLREEYSLEQPVIFLVRLTDVDDTQRTFKTPYYAVNKIKTVLERRGRSW